MRWSWRIGQVFGIGVYIHWTFLILLAWFALMPLDKFLLRLVFTVVLFGIILLHELGHCLMARRFGIQTHEITLLPIGGLARLERMPREPRQEFLVAIAGPAVNVALAILFFALLSLRGIPISALGRSTMEADPMLRLFWVNVMLVLFNMLPAFPMDGGRILRAYLATFMDYVRATRFAANVGQIMALLFGFFGLLYNPYLLFIAFFVWLGAESEASSAQVSSALSGFPVSKAMITNFRTLAVTDPLSKAIEYILADYQQDFPVLSNGKLIGVLTRKSIVKSINEKGPDAMVSDAMETKFITADPYEQLEMAFSRLQECDCPSIPVVRNGLVVGILTMENVGEFVMLQSAIRASGNKG